MKIIACILAGIFTASAALAATGSFSLGVAPVPPQLSASIAFEEFSGNKMLDADEIGALVITVHNSGKGDAYDLVAEIACQQGNKSPCL
jgi:hypothetical protein